MAPNVLFSDFKVNSESQRYNIFRLNKILWAPQKDLGESSKGKDTDDAGKMEVLDLIISPPDY